MQYITPEQAIESTFKSGTNEPLMGTSHLQRIKLIGYILRHFKGLIETNFFRARNLNSGPGSELSYKDIDSDKEIYTKLWYGHYFIASKRERDQNINTYSSVISNYELFIRKDNLEIEDAYTIPIDNIISCMRRFRVGILKNDGDWLTEIIEYCIGYLNTKKYKSANFLTKKFIVRGIKTLIRQYERATNKPYDGVNKLCSDRETVVQDSLLSTSNYYTTSDDTAYNWRISAEDNTVFTGTRLENDIFVQHRVNQYIEEAIDEFTQQIMERNG